MDSDEDEDNPEDNPELGTNVKKKGRDRRSQDTKRQSNDSGRSQRNHNHKRKDQQQQQLDHGNLQKQNDELEYINFPTILGWHFNGFFRRHFSMRKEWADIFNALKEEKPQNPKETFTEKQRRYFWPPKVFGNFFFRGRGWYGDSREVIRDPPDAAFGKDSEGKYVHKIEGVPDDDINQHDFYFDEDSAEWYSKDSHSQNQNNFYYDSRFGIWRLKRYQLKYAGDWWFDDSTGKYFYKDHNNPFQYYYDGIWNVWKKYSSGHSLKESNETYKDYFYDELKSEWILRKTVDESLYDFDENGWRFAKRIRLPGPDDYYFDEFAQDFVLKASGKSKQYAYDSKIGVWRKIGSAKPRCRLTPWEFYWDEQTGTYKKKDAPRAYFEFDQNNRFYRKKKVLLGKHNPRNWKWDERLTIWEFIPKDQSSGLFSKRRTVRDYDKPWLYHWDDLIDKPKTKEVIKEDQDGPLDKDGRPGRKPKTLNEILVSEGMLQPHQNFRTEGGSFDDGDGKRKKLDKTLDRKRLKCGNLKGLVTAEELKAIFTAARDVEPPKRKSSIIDDDEISMNIRGDYFFIRFSSDQAAATAYRTMQHTEINGQKIQLSFPMKYQK